MAMHVDCPLVSRRWEPASIGHPGHSAGADCGACKVACEPTLEPGSWRCPLCSAIADACGASCGSKSCELLKGHSGPHESQSGSQWPQKPAEAPLAPISPEQWADDPAPPSGPGAPVPDLEALARTWASEALTVDGSALVLRMGESWRVLHGHDSPTLAHVDRGELLPVLARVLVVFGCEVRRAVRRSVERRLAAPKTSPAAYAADRAAAALRLQDDALVLHVPEAQRRRVTYGSVLLCPPSASEKRETLVHITEVLAFVIFDAMQQADRDARAEVEERHKRELAEAREAGRQEALAEARRAIDTGTDQHALGFAAGRAEGLEQGKREVCEALRVEALRLRKQANEERDQADARDREAADLRASAEASDIEALVLLRVLRAANGERESA